MPYTTTLVIGAGPAGLAMSRCLTEASVDHVLLERGRVANSWRTERWDSLRLLTPNWQNRLPGRPYQGDDPDGYMTMPEITDHLDAYADSFSAPVQEETTVLSVRPMGGGHPGYAVQTDQGLWFARTVVIASGACSAPAVPAWAHDIQGEIHQVSPIRYRNPELLPDGDVLVVGASASGLQLADELARSGREVTLAAGSHHRVPRTYRGMDVQWWLDASGVLDTRHDQVPDLARARRSPSLQLVGSPERRDLDLGLLSRRGVRVVGRFLGLDHGKAVFGDDLDADVADADRRLTRLLDRFDAHAAAHGLDAELGPARRPRALRLPATPSRIDPVAEGVRSVVWATGFRPNFPWLHCRVLEPSGQLRHDGGVVGEAPGLYALGLPFLRRRRSTFLGGVGDDARDLTGHLLDHLDRVPLVV